MDVTAKYRMTPSGRNINLHPLLFVRVSSILGKHYLSLNQGLIYIVIYIVTPSGRNINLHPLLFVRVSSILGKHYLRVEPRAHLYC